MILADKPVQKETTNNTLLLKNILNIYPKHARQRFFILFFFIISANNTVNPKNIHIPTLCPIFNSHIPISVIYTAKHTYFHIFNFSVNTPHMEINTQNAPNKQYNISIITALSTYWTT